MINLPPHEDVHKCQSLKWAYLKFQGRAYWKIDVIRHQKLENQLISRIFRSNENLMQIMKIHEIMLLCMTYDVADELTDFWAICQISPCEVVQILKKVTLWSSLIYRVRCFQCYPYGMNCSFDKFVLNFVLSLPARSADSDEYSR